MIRRGFWLLAGAALGVTGYRKASRLLQALTGRGLLGGPAATQQRAVQRRAAPYAVRSGRAQPQLVAPQLAPPVAAPPVAAPPVAAPPAQLASKPAPVTSAARIAAAAARATAAAGFVRDVRDGMAEYWDLHRSESDRTLGNQRERMWSGDGQQASREH